MRRIERMRHALGAGVCAVLLCATAAAPGSARAEPAGREVERLGGAYLDRMMERRPDLASALGLHEFDARLNAVTEATLAEDAAWLHGLQGQAAAVPRGELDPDETADLEVLESRIAADLLSLESERTFRTDPGACVALISEPIAVLMRRDPQSLCRRLRAIAARLARVPEVLRAARIVLDRPARLRTEAAIERVEAVLRFYRAEVPDVVRDCRDPRTQAAVAQADSEAVKAAVAYLAFLRDDLLPRSDGPLALGAPALEARLAARERVDTPLDSLLARATRELESAHARMETLAEAVAPGRGLRGALDQLGHDRPRADQLVSMVRGAFEQARDFVNAHDLVAVDGGVRVDGRPSPLGSRFRAPVALDPPLALERTPYRAHLDVRDGDAAEAGFDDHRAGPGVEGSEAAAAHEGWMGHLSQALAWRRVPSRVRQALSTRGTVEGWACYAEDVMREAGFRAGDAGFELAVCQREAVRLARLVVGIMIHARGATPAEAADLFVTRCGLDPADAAREARALAVDPAAIADAIGVWRIEALRDEVRAALGARFDAAAFHAAVLRQGPAPLPVVRRLVLRDLGIRPGGSD